MARLIPIAVITFITLLFIAHFTRKGPVYDLMKPVLDKIEETNGSQNAPSPEKDAEDSSTTDGTSPTDKDKESP